MLKTDFENRGNTMQSYWDNMFIGRIRESSGYSGELTNHVQARIIWQKPYYYTALSIVIKVVDIINRQPIIVCFFVWF